ncbi:tRNA uridine-5-carboxymethylaminomethyl(34) synthesis GTPase MnmE [endosymbiont GvMRE of Glomus versiforme]|uniref:tRNA uridine-5-carboxymethylaminomethyl(34) synthesis GTPase MnmE n=1 Tax=endosymbiont GvMRE of Glomus versiforme TaxID=2039283 RepID=UPI000ECF3681|nr:tRNA uridine-5-carboxymethylaminomethyl(34) synthesis GTPase MnmE [endosymbiont GvMRE of Glomus versiforme]RHZ37292.1 tRNA modification GTPase MnmE [endosymbiont GvMRE of Glomus versiforme]
MFSEKTITALVTIPITQNVALIRISGPKTYNLISKFFDHSLPKYPQKKSQLVFGNIINHNKEIIDQVLLLCFYKPHSFTGEDVIEISCHGNLFIVNQILQLILENGAELAREGEFTKQAFFNGKLNLIQAQAINDLIRAPTLSASKLALHNLSPQTQKKFDKLIEKITDKLLKIIATIEVNIDYPEYDGVELLTSKKALNRLQEIKQELGKLLSLSRQVKVYQEGVKVAIVGKPNVGKSTLLNSLLQEEKAIVSPLAGTTRDVVEGKYNLKGIPLILSDTAGIRGAKNIVEKIGVSRSQEVLEKAELIFFLLDNSQIWSKEDIKVWKLVKNKKTVIIINKIDLKKKLKLPNEILAKNPISINAKNGEIKDLETRVEQLLVKDLGNIHSPYPFLSQSWQQSKLQELIKQIDEITQALQQEIPLDIISGDFQIVFHLLKELSGKEYNGKLLDIIFSEFCLGK